MRAAVILLFYGFVLFVNCDYSTFRSEIQKLIEKGKGLGLSSKVAFGSGALATASVSLFDYAWKNDSGTNTDILLDFSRESKSFHRILMSDIFGGSVHSAVGFKSKRFSVGIGWDRFNFKQLTPRIEVRPLFTSYCNYSKKVDITDLTYKEFYKLYPSVFLPGPKHMFSLTALFYISGFNSSTFLPDTELLEMGSSKYKVYTCLTCQEKLGIELKLGFLDGDSPSLKDLRYANLSVEIDEELQSMEFFVHKVEYFDSPESIRTSGEFQPHDGVKCEGMHLGGEYSETVEMKWPDHLSMSSEYIDYHRKEVSYLDELYNFETGFSKITFRGANLTVNQTKGETYELETYGSSSVIVDHNSDLAFVKLPDGKCKIISENRLKFLKHGVYKEAVLPMMEHPLEMFKFNETMTFKGYCEDSFGVPGKLFLSKSSEGDDDELCVVDNARRGDDWIVGAVDSSEFMTPMWMSEYGYKHEEGQVDTNSRDIDSRTNFLDVSNKQAMLDAFDISHCFKSDHINYYVLLANKQSNGTDDMADGPDGTSYHHKICISITKKRNKEGKEVDSPICSKHVSDLEMGKNGFQATYNHAVTQKLAEALEVYPSRISHLTIDDSMRFVFVAFSLIDFAGLSSYKSVNERQEMLSNAKVAERMKNLKGHVKVSYTIEHEDDDTGEISDVHYFEDNYRVFSYMEVTSATFESVTEEGGMAGRKRGHAMIIVMIVVSFVMASVGLVVGVLVAYKLWRGATSFGYMIHSNVM